MPFYVAITTISFIYVCKILKTANDLSRRKP